MTVGANDLTTLAEVKLALRIAQANDDSLLQLLITNLSDFIQQFLNRTIAVDTYTDILNGQGYGAKVIVPSNCPIVSVTSLSICGNALNGVAITDEKTAGYRFDANYIYLNSYSIPKGIANIQVTYTAGYTTIPPSIKQAANELVGLAYKEISRIGEASKVLQGETVNYITEAMQKRVALTLNNWKKVIPV